MSNDIYQIDSHKLIYHVKRVNDWLDGKNIYPIYCEVGLTNACSHRCIFCGLDYMHTRPQFIDTKRLKMFIRDVYRDKKGLKSIMFAGEGEPLLHRDAQDLICFAKMTGLDVAVATNGLLMNEKFSRKCLKYLSWIKISLDAARASTYSSIHATEKNDFTIVLENIKKAVRIKKKEGYPVTIGVQMLLLNQNYKEVPLACSLMKKLGVDYLVIKPYSKHPLSRNDLASELDYTRLMYLEKTIGKYNTKNFKAIFRKDTINMRRKNKPYKKCLALPFWAYISASADVYPCSTFLGLKSFIIGNITKQTFKQILDSKKRKKIMDYLTKKMDPNKCRELCRLDKINAYLNQIIHPSGHQNFI